MATANVSPLLFGRWSLSVTITTVDLGVSNGLGPSASYQVTRSNTGPLLGERPGAWRKTASWPEGATAQEWYDFHRLLDAQYQSLGVPEHMRPHPDLWHIPDTEGDRREVAKRELFAKRPDLDTFARRWAA